MLKIIVNWLSGGGLNALAEAYAARNSATTEQARIAAEVEIAKLEERQANRALGGRITACVQVAWASPYILYGAKLIIWDKMLGWGTTEPLSADLMDLQMRIVTFYFGGVAAVSVVRALRN